MTQSAKSLFMAAERLGNMSGSNPYPPMRIILPWPPKQVFPNFIRGHHWRKSAPFTKSYRDCAQILTREAMGRNVYHTRKGCWQLTAHFFEPNRIKRDQDNMRGALKAAQDGIALAMKVDDATFRMAHHFHGTHPPSGGVIIQIEALLDEAETHDSLAAEMRADAAAIMQRRSKLRYGIGARVDVIHQRPKRTPNSGGKA